MKNQRLAHTKHTQSTQSTQRAQSTYTQSIPRWLSTGECTVLVTQNQTKPILEAATTHARTNLGFDVKTTCAVEAELVPRGRAVLVFTCEAILKALQTQTRLDPDRVRPRDALAVRTLGRCVTPEAARRAIVVPIGIVELYEVTFGTVQTRRVGQRRPFSEALALREAVRRAAPRDALAGVGVRSELAVLAVAAVDCNATRTRLLGEGSEESARFARRCVGALRRRGGGKVADDTEHHHEEAEAQTHHTDQIFCQTRHIELNQPTNQPTTQPTHQLLLQTRSSN